MLEIKNVEVVGLERSLLASGNPMKIGEINTKPVDEDLGPQVEVLERGNRLGSAKQGSGHDNFLSGVDVYYDVKYSMYWSMEFQRYHFNQIISSQSKMHKLLAMGKSDEFQTMFNKYVWKETIEKIAITINEYNDRKPSHGHIWSKKELQENYEKFMEILSNLPMGFEMWMTIKTNYLQLKTMYNQRKGHKLVEDWGYFCDWCSSLPYFKDLTGINT